MTRDTAGTRGTRRDPTLQDFYHDMNQHGAAKYRRVAGRYVVEMDSTPSGWQITVWEAVRRVERYVLPDDGNRYAWDAVGRLEFEDKSEARARFSVLSRKGAVRSFCKSNPYEGPRSAWSERPEGDV